MTTPGKPYKGISMEGMLAAWYARETKVDLADFAQLAARIAAAVPAQAHILEVAPGPGYLAIELAKHDLSVAAIDISASFVRIATENAREAGVSPTFLHGDVHALPYEYGSFDLLVCRAAFKNFSHPIKALHEMRRVLRPDGCAWIIDMRRDTTDEEIDQFVAGRATSRINAAIMSWTFKLMLRKRAYFADDFRRMAVEAGFSACDITRNSIGLEVRLRR